MYKILKNRYIFHFLNILFFFFLIFGFFYSFYHALIALNDLKNMSILYRSDQGFLKDSVEYKRFSEYYIFSFDIYRPSTAAAMMVTASTGFFIGIFKFFIDNKSVKNNFIIFCIIMNASLSYYIQEVFFDFFQYCAVNMNYLEISLTVFFIGRPYYISPKFEKYMYLCNICCFICLIFLVILICFFNKKNVMFYYFFFLYVIFSPLFYKSGIGAPPSIYIIIPTVVLFLIYFLIQKYSFLKYKKLMILFAFFVFLILIINIIVWCYNVKELNEMFTYGAALNSFGLRIFLLTIWSNTINYDKILNRKIKKVVI